MSQNVMTEENRAVELTTPQSSVMSTETSQITNPTASVSDPDAAADAPNGNGSHHAVVSTESSGASSAHNPPASANDTTASPRPTKPPYASSPTALQDMFLNGLRRENIDVVVYFCDGSQERGAVRAFDTFTVLLENRNSGKAQLIYKHAIARIFPTRTPSQLVTPERPNRK